MTSSHSSPTLSRTVQVQLRRLNAQLHRTSTRKSKLRSSNASRPISLEQRRMLYHRCNEISRPTNEAICLSLRSSSPRRATRSERGRRGRRRSRGGNREKPKVRLLHRPAETLSMLLHRRLRRHRSVGRRPREDSPRSARSECSTTSLRSDWRALASLAFEVPADIDLRTDPSRRAAKVPACLRCIEWRRSSLLPWAALHPSARYNASRARCAQLAVPYVVP